MKKFIFSVALCLPLSSFAASFDCQQASTPNEHMICDNPDISSLDETLGQVYKDVLKKDPSNAEVLKLVQRHWIAARSKINTVSEMKLAYSIQIAGLENYKTTEPLPASTGAPEFTPSTNETPKSVENRPTKADSHGKHIPQLAEYLKSYVNINGDYVSTEEVTDGNPALVVCAGSVANDVVNMNKESAIKSGQVDLFFQVQSRIHTAATNATYDMFIHDISKANICGLLP